MGKEEERITCPSSTSIVAVLVNLVLVVGYYCSHWHTWTYIGLICFSNGMKPVAPVVYYLIINGG